MQYNVIHQNWEQIRGSINNAFSQVVAYTDLSASTGSSLVGFIQSGTGATTDTVQNVERLVVSVFQFMTPAQKADVAAGTLSVDCLSAFTAARDFLQTNGNNRGGTIKVTRGYYKMSNTLAFTQYAAGSVHNIYIEGDGIQNTLLDFSSAPAGTDGIVFNPGAQFGLSGFTINGARRSGLVLGNDSTLTNYCEYFYVRDLRIQGCVGDGLISTASYLGELENVYCKGNGGNGFNFQGYHTAMTFSRCNADTNTTGSGFAINGMTYSSFISCASDANKWGYAISNVRGVTLLSCGTEANLRDGWYLFTSTASVGSIPAVVQDIHQLEFIGCQGFGNNVANGAYGNFLSALTANSRPIDFSMQGCGSTQTQGTDKAIYLNGASGTISYKDKTPNHVGNYSYAGTVVTSDYASSTLASGSAISLSNGVVADIITGGLLLPPGDWFVEGVVNYNPAAGTSVTVYEAGIGTASVTFGGDNTYSGFRTAASVPGGIFNQVTPRVPIRSDGTVKVYLVTVAVFSVSTMTAYGTVKAWKA